MTTLPPSQPRLRVYLDADVLFRAATASHPYTASLVVLALSEYTILDAVTSVYAVEEATRNLGEYHSAVVPKLAELLRRSVRLEEMPAPDTVSAYLGLADVKDVINVAAAANAKAQVLLTFNLRHYGTLPQIAVMTPGNLVAQTRQSLFDGLL